MVNEETNRKKKKEEEEEEDKEEEEKQKKKKAYKGSCRTVSPPFLNTVLWEEERLAWVAVEQVRKGCCPVTSENVPDSSASPLVHIGGAVKGAVETEDKGQAHILYSLFPFYFSTFSASTS